MNRRRWTYTRAAFAAATGLGAGALLTALLGGPVYAQNASATPAESPAAAAAPPPPPAETMKVVPAEEKGTTAPAPKKKHKARRVKAEVEPANARLKIKEDTWILTGPSKWTKHVTRGHAGKFVVVTGSTRYYLQIKLKSGETGYIAASAVDLVQPTDKVFQLTSDAPVRNEPNKWAKKVAEVHRGHNVHVVGTALSYMQIRMKNGLVGFIPATALQ